MARTGARVERGVPRLGGWIWWDWLAGLAARDRGLVCLTTTLGFLRGSVFAVFAVFAFFAVFAVFLALGFGAGVSEEGAETGASLVFAIFEFGFCLEFEFEFEFEFGFCFEFEFGFCFEFEFDILLTSELGFDSEEFELWTKQTEAELLAVAVLVLVLVLAVAAPESDSKTGS